jgi:hypothetical protein
LVFSANMHYVDVAETRVRQFAEFESGDVILDIRPENVPPVMDEPLSEKATNVRFIIAGDAYIQKQVGRELAQAWDVMIGDTRPFRVVLLGRADTG